MAGVRVGAVIPAAGAGRRMGGEKKTFLQLGGEPVLLRAIAPFLARNDVVAVVVALAPSDAADPPGWLVDRDERIRVVAGGDTRGASVRSGLAALPDEVTLVAIHDGARPLLADEVLARCIEEAASGVGAVAGWPAVDTMKEVDEGRRVVSTPDRARLWHAHTPQVFPRAMIVEAYGGRGEDESATDDAALVERAGGTVRMIRGDRWNLKLTRSEDLAVAAALLGRAGG
ncbi:MAG TPA: 2-C-methyl-D-erythritol 4-phosphate cytidylyltransferase [Longimicrobiales bacterium]|nr:2-C-methyl-D-erythritol 4-phosphate cytidylyltransferase [Longimicrobiales bacterium]